MNVLCYVILCSCCVVCKFYSPLTHGGGVGAKTEKNMTKDVLNFDFK